MIVYLTQYNIECMSVSLDLHSGHVSPMEFNVENEKKPTNVGWLSRKHIDCK